MFGKYNATVISSTMHIVQSLRSTGSKCFSKSAYHFSKSDTVCWHSPAVPSRGEQSSSLPIVFFFQHNSQLFQS